MLRRFVWLLLEDSWWKTKVRNSGRDWWLTSQGHSPLLPNCSTLVLSRTAYQPARALLSTSCLLDANPVNWPGCSQSLFTSLTTSQTFLSSSLCSSSYYLLSKSVSGTQESSFLLRFPVISDLSNNMRLIWSKWHRCLTLLCHLTFLKFYPFFKVPLNRHSACLECRVILDDTQVKLI